MILPNLILMTMIRVMKVVPMIMIIRIVTLMVIIKKIMFLKLNLLLMVMLKRRKNVKRRIMMKRITKLMFL